MFLHTIFLYLSLLPWRQCFVLDTIPPTLAIAKTPPMRCSYKPKLGSNSGSPRITLPMKIQNRASQGRLIGETNLEKILIASILVTPNLRCPAVSINSFCFLINFIHWSVLKCASSSRLHGTQCTLNWTRLSENEWIYGNFLLKVGFWWFLLVSGFHHPWTASPQVLEYESDPQSTKYPAELLFMLAKSCGKPVISFIHSFAFLHPLHLTHWHQRVIPKNWSNTR